MSSYAPYSDPALNEIYELLFCDKPELLHVAHKQAEQEDILNAILSVESDDNDIQRIALNTALESRIRLLAAFILKTRHVPLEVAELLGVIVEIGLDEGLDVLAAYRDGTARYINHSGKMVIWEAPNTSLQETIDNIFMQSEVVVGRIGPWEGLRKPPPVTGQLRLTFLVSGDLYFGEGPVDVLFRDQMAGPVLLSMTKLMQELIAYQAGDLK